MSYSNRYSVGEEVIYTRLKKKATVQEVIKAENGSPIRYIIKAGWEYWSVPGSVLKYPDFAPNKIKDLQR